MPSISARIPEEDEHALKEVAALLDLTKSAVIRRALREGLSELRIATAVERYQTGEVSANQAARIADVSIAEWLSVARERNLTTHLTPDDLEADIEAIRER